MRIQVDQKIVGYPAVQVRQLMRETVGRGSAICPRNPQVFGFFREKSLEVEGLVQPVHDHFEPSMKGSALAMAKAAPPLRRETADRLITEVINRAIREWR